MTNKEQLIQDIKNRMNEKICVPSIHVQVDQYTSPTDIKTNIESAVQGAFENFKWNIIEAVVEEMYSDEKFELDIGLRY